MVMTGVAALGMGMSKVVRGMLSGGSSSHHSIPAEELRGIAAKYGWWAARRAEAFCPENDTVCVEREAKRLYEVVKHRR